MWLGPAAVIVMAISGITLGWLMLTGSLEPPSRRYRSGFSQVVVIGCGIGVLGLGLRVLVRTIACKGVLVVVDRQRLRIETLRGSVDLDLDQIEFVTSVERRGVRSLSIGDSDGNMHRPILQPAGEDWASVATRLDELLAAHRRRSRHDEDGSCSATVPDAASGAERSTGASQDRPL